MKKFNSAIALSLFGLLLSGGACAEGWYAGLDLTTSKMDLKGEAEWAYNNKIIDNRLNGGSLIAGYDLNSWLAIEGGLHAQRMSQQTTLTGAINGSIDSTIDTRSISIAAKLSQPLAWGFSAYAKPGLAYTSTKVDATSSAYIPSMSMTTQSSQTKGTVHPNLEVGMDYAFNDHFSAGIGYERQFNAMTLGDEHYSLDTFKLGLRYHF
ncbi:porin family protein [Aeromonas finlandensis]|uniref:porin family protein n=1 Tax=Aeromonas finlandensis TaxID=1543375 RepID=UPI00051B22B3|nr:porin family protein [Aeromonas finlandensis]